MERVLVIFAGVIGFAGVATGAAASHLTVGDPHAHDLLDIASRYLLIHAAAILGVVGLLGQVDRPGTRRLAIFAGCLFALGAAFFGGGIVLQVVTQRHALDAIIPIGGISLMIAWLVLAVFGARFVRRSGG